MSSTMALWDYVPTIDLSDYLRPRKTRRPGTCERCARRAELTQAERLLAMRIWNEWHLREEW